MSKSLDFLYNTTFGRACLKVVSTRFVSNVVGLYMDSPLSKHRISKFIKQNDIDMSLCVKDKFKSFNDFFTREQTRTVDMDKQAFISPCDSRLTVYRIKPDSSFKIKNSRYSVQQLLQSTTLADEYSDGYCLVFRLCVDDYHRYCYIDNGTKGKNIFIKGVLHTVNPIAFTDHKVFLENCREYTVLHTENFDDVIQVEVGAMCVGKINNFHEDYTFKKGEPKGMFEFGGSTIVLLVKKDTVEIDKEYCTGKEVIVKYGAKIGTSTKMREA